MALNKIFIHKKDLSYSVVKESDSDITFIREDVLLEWAKEYKRALETHRDERNAYERGEYSVLNFLIDKLNSM